MLGRGSQGTNQITNRDQTRDEHKSGCDDDDEDRTDHAAFQDEKIER
jgi:hypothetical protein